jgi:hypothetical protein
MMGWSDLSGYGLGSILLWGLVATVAMTTILSGSQGMGLSRLSLPFLLGTCFSGNRRRATVLGFTLYLLGGWIFAGFYFLAFALLGRATWWMGAIFGGLHGAFLLVTVLPLAPFVHPRMASDYDGPTKRRTLEPPGFLGLNYGYGTPLTTLLAQIIYGAVLGAAWVIEQ